MIRLMGAKNNEVNIYYGFEFWSMAFYGTVSASIIPGESCWLTYYVIAYPLRHSNASQYCILMLWLTTSPRTS